MTDDSSRNDVSRTETLANTPRTFRRDDGPDRRGFLRGAVATLVAGLGFPGTAAAIDPTNEAALERIERRYADDLVARRTFETAGDDLLDVLVDRGHVEAATADAFDEITVSAFVLDGTASARIEGVRETGDGTLTVLVEPGTGRRYAVANRDGETTVLDPTVEDDEVDTDNCIVGHECMVESACDTGCQTREVHCCADGSCYLGSGIDCCEGTCYTSCSYVC